MGTLRVMNERGDTAYAWPAEMPADEVEKVFDSIMAQGGMLAYKMDPDAKEGTDGTIIRRFDQEAEEILIAPAFKGG